MSGHKFIWTCDMIVSGSLNWILGNKNVFILLGEVNKIWIVVGGGGI